MKKRIISIALLQALSILSITAQDSKRTNIWYFGRNAGMDFNTNPPTALTNGMINIWEGCATICDTSGQLLMYTDGIKIWNKNHQVMPGATNLGGDNSATQSGIIVPKPNSSNEIFVFSVDKEGQSGGLRYSVVDMNQNGGLGGLISTNNILLTPSTEKVTVIKHCNNTDFWIVGHKFNSTNFYIWELTENGITNSPLIIDIGAYHGSSGVDAIGYMKASPNGNKIALATGYTDDEIEIYDFDNETGILSNLITIDINQLVNPYGIEFSPNGNLLYFAGAQNQPNVYIFQLDLTLSTPIEILSSIQIIGTGTTSTFGSIQSAPDGKLYIAKENSLYLSVINSPNSIGNNCDFVEDYFYLAGKKSEFGLPNLVPGYFAQPVTVSIVDTINLCQGTAKLTGITNARGDSISFEWYFNNQVVENQNSTSIFVDSSGEYSFKVYIFNDCIPQPFVYSQSISINLAEPNYTQYIQTTICQGEVYEGYSASGNYTDVFTAANGCDSTRILTLTVLPSPTINQSASICQGEVYEGYSTNGTYKDVFMTANGCDSTRTLMLTVLPKVTSTKTVSICQSEMYEGYSSSGTYVDVFTAANGCDSTRTLILTVLPNPTSNQSVSICQSEVYEGYSKSGTYTDIFKATNGCDSTRTLILTVLPNSTSNQSVSICQGEVYEGYSKSGTYTDIFTAANGCDSTRTLNLKVYDAYETSESITICEGSSYNFNGINISTEGTYTDTLSTVFGCDSIFNLEISIAESDFLGSDTILCSQAEYMLKSPSDNTRWFDNDISRSKRVNSSGLYWASILDANGCEITDSVHVQFNIKSYVPNVFTPNDDGINDCFEPFFSVEGDILKYRFSVCDRWGNRIFTTSSISDCWDGKSREKDCSPGVYIYFVEIYTEHCGLTLLRGDLTLIR